MSAHIRARRLRASSLEPPSHPLSPHIRAMKAVRNMLGLPPSGDAARALEWEKAVQSGTLYEGTLYMSRFKRDPVEVRLVRDAVLVMKPGGKPMKDYKRVRCLHQLAMIYSHDLRSQFPCSCCQYPRTTAAQNAASL